MGLATVCNINRLCGSLKNCNQTLLFDEKPRKNKDICGSITRYIGKGGYTGQVVTALQKLQGAYSQHSEFPGDFLSCRLCHSIVPTTPQIKYIKKKYISKQISSRLRSKTPTGCCKQVASLAKICIYSGPVGLRLASRVLRQPWGFPTLHSYLNCPNFASHLSYKTVHKQLSVLSPIHFQSPFIYFAFLTSTSFHIYSKHVLRLYFFSFYRCYQNAALELFIFRK